MVFSCQDCWQENSEEGKRTTVIIYSSLLCLSEALGMGRDLASCSFSQKLPRTWWERWLLTTLGLAPASFMKMPVVSTAKCLGYTPFVVVVFWRALRSWLMSLRAGSGWPQGGQNSSAHPFPHSQAGPCAGSCRDLWKGDSVFCC